MDKIDKAVDKLLNETDGKELDNAVKEMLKDAPTFFYAYIEERDGPQDGEVVIRAQTKQQAREAAKKELSYEYKVGRIMTPLEYIKNMGFPVEELEEMLPDDIAIAKELKDGEYQITDLGT